MRNKHSDTYEGDSGWKDIGPPKLSDSFCMTVVVPYGEGVGWLIVGYLGSYAFCAAIILAVASEAAGASSLSSYSWPGL